MILILVKTNRKFWNLNDNFMEQRRVQIIRVGPEIDGS